MGQIQRHQPLYEQLMWRIKSQVASGALRQGDKLPSVREMALIEGLNPNTVAKAYKALEQQQVFNSDWMKLSLRRSGLRFRGRSCSTGLIWAMAYKGKNTRRKHDVSG